MDRRQFLRSSAALAVSLATPGRVALAQVAVNPRKVLIVGAGLSGLVSAFDLKKVGYDVTVFEAQTRIGGRVYTLRTFADGQYADAGAARIPHNHDLTHRYVREFGLELLPFYPSENKFTLVGKDGPKHVGWGDFEDATSAVMGLDEPGHWKKLKGGNDLLPQAFAERLKGDIRTGVVVNKIAQDPTGVTMTVNENGRTQTLRGDIAIVTAPLTVLKNIEFSPTLPDRQARVIETATYESASRVFIQTRDRFWLNRKLNGFGFGEKYDEVWDSSFGETGASGIIQSYSRGSYSSSLTQLSAEKRIETSLASLEKLFPQIRPHFFKGLSKCWSEDPWAKGAWAHLGGDQMALLAKAEGRIFFAGEHLSGNPSWMQGALESGLRVVKQVIAAQPLTGRPAVV